MVFGATLLTWLLDRLPILVWAGAALLGWVAGELMATEPTCSPTSALLPDAGLAAQASVAPAARAAAIAES